VSARVASLRLVTNPPDGIVLVDTSSYSMEDLEASRDSFAPDLISG